MRDKPRQVSAPYSNCFNSPSGTSSPDVREQKSNISTAASSGCKQSPAASRSQSFHAEAAGGTCREQNHAKQVFVPRSERLVFTKQRVPPRSPYPGPSSKPRGQICFIFAVVDRHFYRPARGSGSIDRRRWYLSCCQQYPRRFLDPSLTAQAEPREIPGMFSPFDLRTSGPVCCEAQAAVSEKTAKTCDSTAARYLGHVLTAASAENIPGVDAAIRLCSNTTSKKIYIDTVKKPVSNRSDLIDTVKKPVWNRSDLSNPEIDNTRIESLMACTKGQVLGTENDPIGGFLNGRYQDSLSLAYLRKNSFQQIRAGSLQQLEPATSSPCHALPRHPDLYMAHGGAEAADRNSSSSNISPSGSFGSPSPLRVSDHLSAAYSAKL